MPSDRIAIPDQPFRLHRCASRLKSRRMTWQYPTVHQHPSRIIDSDPALFDKSLLDADVFPRACPGSRELNTKFHPGWQEPVLSRQCMIKDPEL